MASVIPCLLRKRFCRIYCGQKIGRQSTANSSIWGRHPATSAMHRLPSAMCSMILPWCCTGVLAAHSHCHRASSTNAAPHRMAYSYTEGRSSR